MSQPKFAVGQVVAFDRPGSRSRYAFVLAIVEEYDTVFYRVDRKNCLSESMLRPLTALECGRKVGDEVSE